MSAFFSLAINGKALDNMAANRIQTLSIRYQMGQVGSGSFTVSDRNLMYGTFIKEWDKIEIEYGYKSTRNLSSRITSALGPFAVLGEFLSPFAGQCGAPSVKMGADGTIVTEVPFYELSIAGCLTPKTKTWPAQTGGQATAFEIVSDVITSLGATKRLVMFGRSGEIFTNKSSIRQGNETDIAFLNRLASEFRCVSPIILPNPTGSTVVFVDAQGLIDPSTQTILKTSALPGLGDIELIYGSDSGNVITAEFSADPSTSGAGQGISVDSQGRVTRYEVSPAGTIVYTLDTKAVRAELAAAGSLRSQAEVVKMVSDARSFSDPLVQKFWKKELVNSPPPTGGWVLKAKMFGNPELVPGARIAPTEGFPAKFQPGLTLNSTLSYWTLFGVSHSFTPDGYFTELEARR